MSAINEEGSVSPSKLGARGTECAGASSSLFGTNRSAWQHLAEHGQALARTAVTALGRGGDSASARAEAVLIPASPAGRFSRRRIEPRRTFEPERLFLIAGRPTLRSRGMKKASEYRAHARECRELASKMETAADREQMLVMAAHWERLARDRAELIRRHPELATDGEREEEGRGASTR